MLADLGLLSQTCNKTHFLIWDTACENVSLGIMRLQRPWSACTSAQSDQGLQCPLTESLDTTECMNGEQRSGWYFCACTDVRMYRWSESAHFMHLKGSFSLDEAQTVYLFTPVRPEQIVTVQIHIRCHFPFYLIIFYTVCQQFLDTWKGSEKNLYIQELTHLSRGNSQNDNWQTMQTQLRLHCLH